MGIAKRLGLLLLMVALVSLSLPVHIAGASGTTVEINNGNTITLGVSQTITASGTSGIPVAVKNLPDGAPANGLAAFQFDFNWDKDVIHVDSAFAATTAGWTAILPGAPNNTTGTVTVAGFTTTFSTDDIILLYFGITAVGNAGDSTSIDVTITRLYDKNNVIIPATPVNALVSIPMGKLVSIAVTPAAPSIMVGETQQFTATGTYTDAHTANITSTVTWASHNSSVATMDTTGLATSHAAGTTAIIATLYTIDGTTTLTVTAVESKEVVASPAKTEPSITTNVSESRDSIDEKGAVAKEVTAESENNTIELAVDEGTTTVKVPSKLTNWWLIGGIAGVVGIGVVIWLVFRRRTA